MMVKTIDEILRPIKEEIKECMENHKGEYCHDELSGEIIEDPHLNVLVNGYYFEVRECHFGVEGDGTLVMVVNESEWE